MRGDSDGVREASESAAALFDAELPAVVAKVLRDFVSSEVVCGSVFELMYLIWSSLDAAKHGHVATLRAAIAATPMRLLVAGFARHAFDSDTTVQVFAVYNKVAEHHEFGHVPDSELMLS